MCVCLCWEGGGGFSYWRVEGGLASFHWGGLARAKAASMALQQMGLGCTRRFILGNDGLSATPLPSELSWRWSTMLRGGSKGDTGYAGNTPCTSPGASTSRFHRLVAHRKASQLL